MAETTRMGCEVRGQWLRADGQPDPRRFTIQPAHGGLYSGAWYSAGEIVVTPAADGTWRVTLPPSSALGPYTVVHRSQRFRLVVPERAGVEFRQVAEPVE